MDFDEIYSQYSPKIFRVCMAYVNDRERARDLTQETFISVWQHLGTFRNESAVSTWIYRIATNNCLRSLERSKRMPVTELKFDVPAVHEETQEEKLHYLNQCISELEEMERIIISLVLED